MADTSMPNLLATDAEKLSPAFGLKLFRYFYSSYINGNNSYMVTRNARFRMNKLYADGKQPMEQFVDQMNINGKRAFINIDFTPLPVGPALIEVIMGGFMNQKEKVRLTAIDYESQRKKEYNKKKAIFNIREKETIDALQEQIGQQVFDPQIQGIEDEDDVDLHFEIAYRLEEESIMENGVEMVLYDNDSEELKRAILDNIITYGYAGTRTLYDSNGKIKIRLANPYNSITSNSEKANLADAVFKGELVAMKISEARMLFNGKLTEKQLWEAAIKSSAGTGNPQQSNGMAWNDNFNHAPTRPYDGYSIKILDLEVATTKENIYEEKTNAFGNKIVNRRKSYPKNEENKTVTSKPVEAFLSGFWIVDTEFVFDYGYDCNMIKPSHEVHRAYSKWNFYMPKNFEMSNTCLMDKSRPHINAMQLAYLKIIQIQAKLRPQGLMIAIDGLQGVDMGTGGILEPIQLQEIHDQTGNVYYNRKDDAGEIQNVGSPIQEIANNAGSALSELEAIFNFHRQELRNSTGVNEYRQGVSVNPRIGKGVQENQLKSSFNTTKYIYDAYVSILQDTARNIIFMLKDIADYMDKPYDGYVFDLGDDAFSFIKRSKEVRNVIYNSKVELLPNDDELALIAQKSSIALQAGLITFADDMVITSIPNYKQAIQYLIKAERKKRARDKKDAQENSTQNAMVQGQIAQQIEQMKQAGVNNKAMIGIGVEKQKLESAISIKQTGFLLDMQKFYLENNIPMPEEVKQQMADFYQAQAAKEQQEQQQLMDVAQQQTQ